MSTLSQFAGCGGDSTIVGEYKIVTNAPSPILSFSGQEWLRSGSIKSYNSDYASSIAFAPQLGVYGSDVNAYRIDGFSQYETPLTSYIGGKYLISVDQSLRYSTTPDFATATNVPGQTISASNGSHAIGLVKSNLSYNGITPRWSTDGINWTNVGGNWSGPDSRRIAVVGATGWIVLGDSGVQGPSTSNYGYINNTDPSGTWTVTVAPMFTWNNGAGIVSPIGGVYGNGIFVIIASNGTQNSQSYNKVLTIASPGAPLIDRTANISELSQYTGTPTSIVFTGTHFVMAVNTTNANTLSYSVNYYRSTDGITWTAVSTNLPASLTSSDGAMASDGAGTILSYSTQLNIDLRSIMLISRDHGVTWSAIQIYSGKSAVNANMYASYANGRWLIIHTIQASGIGATRTSILDLGPTIPTTPHYIGHQYIYENDQYFRIK